MSLVPGGINIPAIIAAADATDDVTQGYAAVAASPSVTATAPSARVLSLLKLLHLHFICGVVTGADIPWI